MALCERAVGSIFGGEEEMGRLREVLGYFKEQMGLGAGG